MRRTTAIAVLTTAALALAGCSASAGDDPKPTATVTATKAPTLSAAEQRTACVDAWAALLQANSDAPSDQAPTACDDVPESDRLAAYVEGMQQRNQANRDTLTDCLDTPGCTSLPIP